MRKRRGNAIQAVKPNCDLLFESFYCINAGTQLSSAARVLLLDVLAELLTNKDPRPRFFVTKRGAPAKNRDVAIAFEVEAMVRSSPATNTKKAFAQVAHNWSSPERRVDAKSVANIYSKRREEAVALLEASGDDLEALVKRNQVLIAISQNAART